MKVLVSNPGTGVFILETVTAYKEAGILSQFYTTFVSNINVPFYNLINNKKFKNETLKKRTHPVRCSNTNPPDIIHLFSDPWLYKSQNLFIDSPDVNAACKNRNKHDSHLFLRGQRRKVP